MKKAKINNNKRNSKKEEIVQTDDVSVKRVAIAIVSIVVVFMSFYFLTDYLLSKRANNETVVPTVEATNEISFNDLYKQSDSTYYVLAILDSDKNKDKYSIYVNNVKPLYYIDMNDAFNKSHIGDKAVIADSVKDIVSDSYNGLVKDDLVVV